jgi:Transcriptional regulator, AbiEi antitoxin/Protein of unknown function (DUF559)
MADKTRELIEYARANGGVVTRGEALAIGISKTTLARRANAGILRRIERGVFMLAGTEHEHDSILEAACRKLEAVVSHESAGRLHQFDGLPWIMPTVTVPHRRTYIFEGVVVHQSTDISDDQLVLINRLPVTNPERTIIDLAASVSERRIDWILDRALSSGSVDLERLALLFADIGRRGKPGTTSIRKLLEKRGQEYVPPDTVLEQRLLAIIENADLPRPTPQFTPTWLAPTNGRVDLAYEDHRLIIEGDSRKWHLLMKSFETDRQRDNQAQLAGWRILRYTWRQIVDEPEMITSSIGRALGS